MILFLLEWKMLKIFLSGVQLHFERPLEPCTKYIKGQNCLTIKVPYIKMCMFVSVHGKRIDLRETSSLEVLGLTLFESSSILSDSLPMDMRISPCCCLVSAISTGTMASLAVGCGGGAGAGGGGAAYGAVIICGWGAIIG